MASTTNSNPFNTNQNPYASDDSAAPLRLTLGQALQELPGQYLRVLTRPSVRTFVEEKDKAGWGIIWIQLIMLSVVDAIISYVAFRISPPNLSSFGGNGVSLATLQSAYLLTSIILEIVLTPVSFLLVGGILFLIAKLFGGKGSYIEQIYTTLLFGVPLVILSYLLTLVPATSSWLPYIPHIYSVVLIILAMIAVHRRSGTTPQKISTLQ
jgi:hypothetical protein